MKYRDSQIEVITALRGVAALSVAWYHFTISDGFLQSGWLKASGIYGWQGVDIFFVISGFIIPFSLYQMRYRMAMHAGRFLLKRVIRIDPPYLATIALTIVLWYLAAATPGFRGPPPSVELIQLLAHLGYLNSFLGGPWLLPIFWTLALEFQFYILVALIFPLITHATAWIRYCALGALCGSVFMMPDRAFVFHYLGPFVLGILTFQKYVGLTSVRCYLLVLPIVLAITLASLSIASAVAALITALIIAFLRIPRVAPLVFLGGISYSLYLVHLPIGGRVVNLGARFAHTTAMQIIVLAAAIAISIFAAYLMHRFVERPALKWSASLDYEHKSVSTSISR